MNEQDLARLEIVLDGQMGTLPDPVPYNADPQEIKRIVEEAVAAGLPGIDAQQVDLTNFVVQPLQARDDLPNRILVRPKTEFG